MSENLQFATKNARGPKPLTHCKYGHELTEENTYQTYRNGIKNGRKCRQCHRNLNKVYRENYPEVTYKNKMQFQLRQRYGINSLEERDKLLESQGGKCAICETSDCVWGAGFKNVWHIDHKHDGTANHRGVICATCNHTIGRANDNPELLERMAAYIRSYQ